MTAVPEFSGEPSFLLQTRESETRGGYQHCGSEGNNHHLQTIPNVGECLHDFPLNPHPSLGGKLGRHYSLSATDEETETHRREGICRRPCNGKDQTAADQAQVSWHSVCSTHTRSHRHIRRPRLLCPGFEKPQWPSCYPKPSPYWELPASTWSQNFLAGPSPSQVAAKEVRCGWLGSPITAYYRWVGDLHNSDVLLHSSEG